MTNWLRKEIRSAKNKIKAGPPAGAGVVIYEIDTNNFRDKLGLKLLVSGAQPVAEYAPSPLGNKYSRSPWPQQT